MFSTEVDTCDAILFMISTSVSKDLFQALPQARRVRRGLLRVARISAVAGGVLGVLLSIYLSTIVQAMTVFYSLLGVSLFVPVLGGLYSRRAGQAEALAPSPRASLLLVVRFGVAGRYPWLDPTLSGLMAAAIAFLIVMMSTRRAGQSA